VRPPGRRASWLAPVVAAVLLVTVSSAGFAAFVRTATVNGDAERASFGLVVTEIAFVTDPVYPTLATSVLPAVTAMAWINNTVPNDVVNLSVVFENTGTAPVENVAPGLSTFTGGYAPGCDFRTTMTSAALNTPPGGTLGPGASFTTYWTFTAGPNLAACAGEPYFAFSITFTGTSGD
jgi:hypothetical protein